MFQPWIKRKSLKKPLNGKHLVVNGEPPSMIMLLSLSALLVVVGVFVVQKSLASNWWSLQPKPAATPASTPTPTATPTPTFIPTPTPTPTPTPVSGSAGRRLY
jgi:hypothetical protein